MDEEKSKIEELKENLYSKTAYTPPSDTPTPLERAEEPNTSPNWGSPGLKDIILEKHQEEIHSTGVRRFFIFSLIFFIAAIGVGIYVYLGGSNFISTKNVDIQITGPVMTPAGAPLALNVTVINKNNADLQTANLTVQYPDSTMNASDTNQTLSFDKTTLGGIKAGEEITHTFNSAIFGQKGDVKEMKFTVEYKLKGSTATFYKDKTYDVTIGDTPVAISVAEPQNVISGNNFSTSITVAANSTDVLNNVVVQAEYPYGYTSGSSDPQASSGDNFWKLGDLAPGDKKIITLHGTIVGEDQEQRTFRFYVGIGDPSNSSSLKVPLVSTSETVTISRPSLGVSIGLNGTVDGDYTAPVARPISALVKFQNNSPDKVSNAKLVVKINGSALDRSSVIPQGGFYDSNSGTITWTASDIPALAALAPGDSGTASFNFASLNLPAGSKNQEIDLEADISGTSAANSQTEGSSATRAVKIASQVNLSGKSLFSKGPFKNTGRIPPKAGATTTYTVLIDLGNTQNDISNSVLIARLGPNVTWVTSATNENIAYDPSSNTITWNVGTLASGAGFSSSGREAAVQVSILPSIGQIGTVPNLLAGINFTGTDTFTHQSVTASLGGINTVISDPSYVQGDEIVTK